MTTVSTNDYFNTHLRQPKGYGLWAFRIAGEVHFLTGSYGDCKKMAIATAENRQTDRIEVLG